MGLFSPKNNTITDKQMASLSTRAQKASTESLFSAKAIAGRKASEAQRRKADQS